MKKTLLTLLVAPFLLMGEEAQEEAIDINKISEALGHLLGKNIQHLDVNFDISQIIKGIQDEVKGVESPMNESDCVKAISSLQQKMQEKKADENLKQAEMFLSENRKRKEVKEILDGKVQYTIDKISQGKAVQQHGRPLLRYTGKFLDGKVFAKTESDEPLNLDDAIPGLVEAVVGMHEGEKRTIYIHPDLAFGKGGFFPAQSLVTFEVEVVSAEAPAKEESKEEPISLEEAAKQEVVR